MKSLRGILKIKIACLRYSLLEVSLSCLNYAFMNKVPYPEVKEAIKSNMETYLHPYNVGRETEQDMSIRILPSDLRIILS